MQNVINSFKGTALGVAEYLTPVLKVSFLMGDRLALLETTLCIVEH